MLNPKQQAKMAVLKHLSKMMDDMMGAKLKSPKHSMIKPVEAHMEVDMIPKSHQEDPLSPSDPLSDGMTDPTASHTTSHDPDEEADMDMLRHHYSSLK